MILATDVMDTAGRLLLSRGQPIARKHLNIFKMWGVPEVTGQTDRTGTNRSRHRTVDPEATRRVAEALKPVFSDNDLTHPAVAEIFRQAVVCRSRRAADHSPGRPHEPAQRPRSPSAGVDMRKKIRSRDIKLPEVPSIIFTLNDIIADPFSSADDIARVINTSPGLSALLLRIVNSAFYGFPSRIDSVTRAVTIIGSKEVSALAVGITTMEDLQGHPQTGFRHAGLHPPQPGLRCPVTYPGCRGQHSQYRATLRIRTPS
jgi:hypothetical protein